MKFKGFSSNSIQAKPTFRNTQTQLMFDRLKFIVGVKKVIVGHMDAWAYGRSNGGWNASLVPGSIYPDANGCLDFKDRIALVGWDIGGIESGTNNLINNVDKNYVLNDININYNYDYINVVTWHCGNPQGGGYTSRYSTNSVKEIIKNFNDSDPYNSIISIINSPNTLQNQFFHSYLDRAVSFFKDPRISNIPIIFRPFHEANMTVQSLGQGFWWDVSTQLPSNITTHSAADFKKFWILVVSYFRVKGVNNLLYALSLNNSNSFSNSYIQSFYPGDDFVDIIGVDDYQRAQENNQYYFTSTFKQRLISECIHLTAFAKSRGKIAAITEVGASALEYSDWATRLKPENTNWYTKVLLKIILDARIEIAFFMLWRNDRNHPREFYCSYKEHQSLDDFRKMYSNNSLVYRNLILKNKFLHSLPNFDPKLIIQNPKVTF